MFKKSARSYRQEGKGLDESPHLGYLLVWLNYPRRPQCSRVLSQEGTAVWARLWMADELYHEFLKITALRRAWHLAYEDARDAFLEDPLGYEDFAAELEIHLQDLQRHVRSGTYEPRPLKRVDVPKTSLAVRPGTVPEIEDGIVMFAIMSQIAPLIDKKMSDSVYAYRVGSTRPASTLFEHRDLRFLRRKTKRRAAIFREWYAQWPAFQEEGVKLYLRRGYRYLSVSDIAAYYENISLPVLRDILLAHLPKQQRIINLLMRILQAWVWPTEAGFHVPRGIPQGPDFSGFLANVYLMPLDKNLEGYGRRHVIRYIRYVDDVRIFSKTEEDARAVLSIMNSTLRSLQLNIQGSKTEVFRGREIERELVDTMFEKIDALAEKATARKLSSPECTRIENRARKLFSQMRRENDRGKKGGRRLRRLLTALIAIKSPIAVRHCFKVIAEDPEHRLNEKVWKYFVCFPRASTISDRVLRLLASKVVAHYATQESDLIKVLRYNGVNGATVNRLARYALTTSRHWHVKQQFLRSLCSISPERETIRVIQKLFERSENSDVRRAALLCMISTNTALTDEIIRRLYRELDPKLLRTGRYLWSLSHDNAVAQRELSSLARIDDDRLMVDKIYKWSMFAKLRNAHIRAQAKVVLLQWQKICRRRQVRERLRTLLTHF